ncbi:MAG: helix-turn-helix domain-containing protein [Eubacteriales bacterium]|nr:helix-turn-helix domain-containing protein [Eubacteriales bacterium]
MSYISDDIKSYFGVSDYDEPSLEHIGRSKMDGAPIGSGRYPLGSGEDPHQRLGNLETRVKSMRNSGLRDPEIAKALGYKSSGELRKAYSFAINERKNETISYAKKGLSEGKTISELAKELGVPASSLSYMIKDNVAAKTREAQTTVDFLREQVKEKKMIDVGEGVELDLNISATKKDYALKELQQEGYNLYKARMNQVTNPDQTTVMYVLADKNVPYKDVYNFENIKSINEYKFETDANGKESVKKAFEYPESMDSSRLMVRYGDDISPDGHKGIEKDGIIELRRGCPDLDLGASSYAQVRILVDGKKYLKGMAIYSDDIPKGYDVVFNTNKAKGEDVLKKIKTDDPNNPFNSLLKENGGQYHYIDKDGKEKLGLINKTREEGDWNEWSDKLSAQFLSKQPKKLIQKQAELTLNDRRLELEEIKSITNPVVKKKLLESFADDCDKTASHLYMASLPRQKYQVILPLPTMSDNEVYAPNYRNGEKIALIRYPHAGTFEIPILTVNNNHPDGVRIFSKTPKDMVGISAKNAARLSGADFDGDTVMCIPCNSQSSRVKIMSTPPLKGLEGFDPKMEYGYSKKTVDSNGKEHYFANGKEFKPMSAAQKQREMGMISNLITDMTIKGASENELARATKHSMTVIDAEKHKLDYRQSEKDNGIKELKKLYQANVDENGNVRYGGVSTLISRAKSETRILKQKGSPIYDAETGEKKYKQVRETYIDKNGKEQVRTTKSNQMSDTKDAHTLSTGTEVERIYANYANSLKALANDARKEYLSTNTKIYKPAANAKYQKEVKELDAELFLATKNKPLERRAQAIATSKIRAMQKQYEDEGVTWPKGDRKKYSNRALLDARLQVGAKRHAIDITPGQWKAIQEGAISGTKLWKILRYSDSDKIRKYATPKQYKQVTPAMIRKMERMYNSGDYTMSEIAQAIGKSPTTVREYLKAS